VVTGASSKQVRVRTDASLLSAFEAIADRCPPNRRAEILHGITSLFLEGAAAFGEQHLLLFDEIFDRLITQIEAEARFKLSVSLAAVANAPPRIVRRLAHDDDAYVAGPVLEYSELLAELDLIDLAKGKSQGHLLAISGRNRITEPVTDVLVRRGDREVVRRVARNLGARISHAGFATLVKKAGQDGILAETVSHRADIPQPLFRALLLEATTVVQRRLFEAATPETGIRIRRVLSEISKELASKNEAGHAAIERAIQKIGHDTNLENATLIRLADAGDYEVTIVALASRCKIPMTIINRIVANKHTDPALILCKGVGLDWSAARAVILSRSKQDGIADLTLNNKRRAFEKMPTEMAQDIVRHWKTLYKAGEEIGQAKITM
jgi:uncharacterized protein (DUF2336 family)